MKEFEHLDRISTIINRAQKDAFEFEEIEKMVTNAWETRGIMRKYTLRTFQRDLNEVAEKFGVEIRFNRRTKKYEINEDESKPINFNVLESFDIIHTFQLSKGLESFVFFDNQVSEGTEHLSSLLYAIKNNFYVSFQHHQDWVESSIDRTVKPLALKEVKKSWYLVALNEANELRNYGLNRLHQVVINPQKFERDPSFDFPATYKHVFGIFNNRDGIVQTIILEFTRLLGNYIKSKPIHPTQNVLEENDEMVKISLDLKINSELISEILSFGEHVKVIGPEELRTKIRQTAKNILKSLE